MNFCGISSLSNVVGTWKGKVGQKGCFTENGISEMDDKTKINQ